jgi:hypothetical protein
MIATKLAQKRTTEPRLMWKRMVARYWCRKE